MILSCTAAGLLTMSLKTAQTQGRHWRATPGLQPSLHKETTRACTTHSWISVPGSGNSGAHTSKPSIACACVRGTVQRVHDVKQEGLADGCGLGALIMQWCQCEGVHPCQAGSALEQARCISRALAQRAASRTRRNKRHNACQRGVCCCMLRAPQS